MTKKRGNIPKRPVKQVEAIEPASPPKSGELFGTFTKVALAINGLLAGAGYLFLAGYLSKVGIDISELEIGLPSLLLNGYIFALETLILGDEDIRWLKMTVFFSIVGLLIYFLTMRAFSNKIGKELRTMLAVAIAPAVGLVLMLAPAWIFSIGEGSAFKTDISEMGLPSQESTSKTQAVRTSEGHLRGQLVIADQRYTYLRSDNVIYKIANDSQTVVRTITFTPDESDKPEEQDGQ